MQKDDVIKALGALSHATRLDAFRALVVAGPEGLTPGQLVEMLDASYANVGFHLKELSIAGLVTQEQVGRNVIYRAAYDRMNAVLGFLTENCCKGTRTAKRPEAGCAKC